MYHIAAYTHTYHIYLLRTEISDSEVLRRPTPVSTFRLLYLQPCVRNWNGTRCGFGLIRLLTAWRHKCRVHYVVSELIFNEIDCVPTPDLV